MEPNSNSNLTKEGIMATCLQVAPCSRKQGSWSTLPEINSKNGPPVQRTHRRSSGDQSSCLTSLLFSSCTARPGVPALMPCRAPLQDMLRVKCSLQAGMRGLLGFPPPCSSHCSPSGGLHCHLMSYKTISGCQLTSATYTSRGGILQLLQ